jgi:hypothetical protein
MSDQYALEKLRRLGLVHQMADGAEGVTITAQYRGSPASNDRTAWKAEMEAWKEDLDGTLAKHGAELVPNSMSLLAQTVEALVPTSKLDELASALKTDNVRVDLVVPREGVND